jgi:tetratricopeptide (TPR) repeat protein
MNNVCLCVGNYARNPFYIKLSDISVYSIEELCYYFMDMAHVVDDSIVSEELVAWIKNECGLSELADELDVYPRKHMSVASFVSTIFEYTGMYDENTVQRVDHILKSQAALTPVEKYKKRAQYLYQQGRFRQALMIYRELVDYVSYRDTATKALLYYNMASIYAMDFAYSIAAEYYYESYLLKPDRQTRLSYILANKMAMTDYAYGAFKRENPEWEQEYDTVETMYKDTLAKWEESKEYMALTQIKELKENGDMEQYGEESNNLISKMKSDYKRQTQN